MELAYARLLLALNHLFEEIALVWYEKVLNVPKSTVSKTATMMPERLVTIKRAIFLFVVDSTLILARQYAGW